jgi:hypothetical protein
MLFRKDFLFLTKPLYESEFLRKNVEAPDIAHCERLPPLPCSRE